MGFIVVALLVLYLLKETSVKMALGCIIVIASSLIIIDNDMIDSEWRKASAGLADLERSLGRGHSFNQASFNALHYFSTYLSRVIWTIARLTLCNISIVIGIILVIEPEVTAFCRKLFQCLKPRNNHRN